MVYLLHMKNQNIFVSVLVILLAIAAGVLISRRPAVVPASQETDSAIPSDKTFVLACDAGKSMSLVFHLPEDTSVEVSLSDGRMLTLANTSTTAGASYTSADGIVVLGLTGSTLTLTEAAVPTYANCALASAQAES